MRQIRILIADHHEAVREGVRSVLVKHPGWEICGEAANGWDAIESARSLKPDVVVLDFRMPILSGLEAAPVIKKELPGAEILILSLYNSEHMLPLALRAGAGDFVSKYNMRTALVPAIEKLLASQDPLE
jgi:two-component system, NarL family, response regulator NreC